MTQEKPAMDAKKIFASMIVAVALVASVPARTHAQVGLDVSLTVFHDNLRAYGDWEVHPRFGNVWIPHREFVGGTWRPYSKGYWGYTDVGWTWVSDEPFGWATYHYGRWAFDPAYGWIWVPDTVWGPSWVSWRSGGEYPGWAPLAPGWAISADFDPPIDSFAFVFVPTRFMTERTLATYIVPPARNVTFVRLTTNSTHFVIRGGVYINTGVQVGFVERAVGYPIPRLTVQASEVIGGAHVDRGALVMYRPATVTLRTRVVAGPGPVAVRESVADMQARHATEMRNFEAEQAASRAALERQHDEELAHPPAGMTHE